MAARVLSHPLDVGRRPPRLTRDLTLPLHPTQAMAIARHRRHLSWSLLVAGLSLVATALFAVLAFTGKSQVYTPVFEGVPADPSDVLNCADDPHTYWAAARGHATAQCIFSGDMSLPGGKGVTEAQVVAKCNARTDCAGYTVRTVSSYAPCAACATANVSEDDALASCASMPYNRGQPEFMLVGRKAVANVRQVSGVTQGALHEVRTTTYVRRQA